MIVAGDVALVFNLKCLHCAADIGLGQGLDGVANADVADSDERFVFILGRNRVARQEMDDIEMVADVFLKNERAVIGMAKGEREPLTASNTRMSLDHEESRRIRLHNLGEWADGRRHFDPGNWELFARVGVKDDDGALKCPQPVLFPVNEEANADGHNEQYCQHGQRDFVRLCHVSTRSPCHQSFRFTGQGNQPLVLILWETRKWHPSGAREHL